MNLDSYFFPWVDYHSTSTQYVVSSLLSHFSSECGAHPQLCHVLFCCGFPSFFSLPALDILIIFKAMWRLSFNSNSPSGLSDGIKFVEPYTLMELTVIKFHCIDCTTLTLVDH